MSKFEIISVSLGTGAFNVSVVEGDNVADAMKSYLGEGCEGMEEELKENKEGGWYMVIADESFVIRML